MWNSPNAVQLLATSKDDCEQTLIPAGLKTMLPSLQTETTASLTVNELRPDLLLAQSEEIKNQLLDGTPEKAFLNFSDFFNNFSLYQTRRGKVISESWNKLYNEFSQAFDRRDEILVSDLIQSAIQPLLNKNETVGNDHEK
jgi:hypothetical protein